MRFHFSIAQAACLFSVWSCAAVAAEFPYEAYVIVDGAEIVAGPGHRFYATDRLAHGTKLEIYREEASGWLAIRPPDGSFSWVPAEYVERLDEDDLAKVKQPIGAWIGTTVEHVTEHRQQVILKQGELVQVLGEKRVADKAGKDRLWLKILPPAGEYRWIHLRDVSRQKPEIVESVAAPEPTTVAAPRRFEPAGDAIAIRDLGSPVLQRDEFVAQVQFRSTSGGPAPSLSPDGFVPRKRRSGEQAQEAAQPRSSTEPAQRLAMATRSTSSVSAISTPASGGIATDDLSRQLDQLEIDLSLMLSQDKSQWNLAPLRQKVNQLVEQGADPAARGRARLVLDKIQQFQQAFDIPDNTPLRGSNRAQSTSGTATSQPVDRSLADPRYDAQGWLKPVVSRSNAKPVAEYAVVDGEGQPLCFVSAAPGLNLRSYLNKQVGVYGRRGYLEELKKPHVVAERVIDLDRGWR